MNSTRVDEPDQAIEASDQRGWDRRIATPARRDRPVGNYEPRRTARPPILRALVGLLRPYQWLNLLIVATYIGVSIAGITTSNLGSMYNRQATHGPYPDTIGNIQNIRSDEFWVGTPLALGVLVAPSETRVAQMSAISGWTMRIPTGPAQAILLWDQSLLIITGSSIPQQITFALQWWLPHLLLMLFLPSLFAQFGVRRRFGYAATLVMLFSPAQAWWSLQPGIILGPTVAGCVAMFAAYRRLQRGQWARPLLQAVAGGVLLANVTSRYPVWVLILMGSLLAAVVARILFDPGGHWLRKILAVGSTGTIALGLTGLAIWESIDGLRTFASTVYPGSRRVGSVPVQLSAVFGAPFLHGLVGQAPVGTNASELSTSFNILLVVVALVLPTQRLLRLHWRINIAHWVLAFFGMFWLAWGTLAFGDIGSQMPVLNMVPSYRAIQVVGFIGVILFFLVVGQLEPIQHPMIIAFAGIATWLTCYAGSLLQTNELPALSTNLLWGAALGVGVIVYLLLLWPRRVWVLGLAALLATSVSFDAAPIQIGLGDFRGSAVSAKLLTDGAIARKAGEVWATDLMPMDALLVATGVPSLSGLQRAGPDRAQWAKLDPTGQFENSWNRGAGYVQFEWATNTPVTISDNRFDLVKVQVDPCRLAQLFTNLSHIVSKTRLTGGCLRPVTRFTWARQKMTIYEVTATRIP